MAIQHNTQRRQQAGTNVKERTFVRDPEMYDVVLLNDDFTTMEFVVMLLELVFFKTADEAQSLMMKVHLRGEAVVGTYTYDVARSKVDKSVAMARAEGFPLSLKLRKRS